MKRFLSVWLPRWPIERRNARNTLHGNAAPPPPEALPFVLSTASESGARITAANPPAERLGFHPGMALTDARAIWPSLAVAPAEPERDTKGLKQLALWCRRYSPYTRADAPDGLCLDITGCAHLFGGEAALADDLAARLDGFGLTARIAIAPTIAAAWALARHGEKTPVIVANGAVRGALAPLPAAGLRLDEATVIALEKVGLKHIGDLYGKPRASLAVRFGAPLVQRLDQALGAAGESLSPAAPPALYRAAMRFAEPAVSRNDLDHAARHLARELAAALAEAGMGTRLIDLLLFRTDGGFDTLRVRTSRLSHDGAHLARLIGERLDTLNDHDGFGYDLAALHADAVERMTAQQGVLKSEARTGTGGDAARLIDRLVNRFGAENVTCFFPRASYVPERSAGSVSVLRAGARHDWESHGEHVMDGAPFARPVMLFHPPEPVSVVAELPDSPPERFAWRRMFHRVTRSEGPERIAPEWWRDPGGVMRTRDYYRVEDETGRRFWLYRDGLYGEHDAPRWFIHGVFS